jgi:riboflavin biosynthesis pyrimidine reductase
MPAATSTSRQLVLEETTARRSPRSRVARRPLTDEVASAVASTDKLVSIGGAGLATAAIEVDLVDELRMFRNPVVVGGGTPYLPAGRRCDAIALDLLETRTFGSRVVYERYGRARRDSD